MPVILEPSLQHGMLKAQLHQLKKPLI